jgi:hypothetical protein
VKVVVLVWKSNIFIHNNIRLHESLIVSNTDVWVDTTNKWSNGC